MRRATYADLEAADPLKIAELIAGKLYVTPKLPPRLAHLAMELLCSVGHLDTKGYACWVFYAPEIHLPDRTAANAFDAVVPDLAAWHTERLPRLPEEHVTIAPDWVCEVLSPSTEDYDREKKMQLYADNSVPWAWLVDPIKRIVEVYELGNNRQWREPAVHRDDARVRLAPFDAIELNWAKLWVPGPRRGKTSGDQ